MTACHSMAYKFYTGLSRALNFLDNFSVDNITATTFVFFHVLRKNINSEIQVFIWFCIIHMFL